MQYVLCEYVMFIEFSVLYSIMQVTLQHCSFEYVVQSFVVTSASPTITSSARVKTRRKGVRPERNAGDATRVLLRRALQARPLLLPRTSLSPTPAPLPLLVTLDNQPMDQQRLLLSPQSRSINLSISR